MTFYLTKDSILEVRLDWILSDNLCTWHCIFMVSHDSYQGHAVSTPTKSRKFCFNRKFWIFQECFGSKNSNQTLKTSQNKSNSIKTSMTLEWFCPSTWTILKIQEKTFFSGYHDFPVEPEYKKLMELSMQDEIRKRAEFRQSKLTFLR